MARRQVSIQRSVKDSLLRRGIRVPRMCPCRHGGQPKAWQTWELSSWLTHRLYTLGLSSGGCWSNQPVPHECYCFLGGRPLYVLGISRDQWRCLLSRRPHWPKVLGGGDFGMCGRCYPCPGCGSETDEHPPSCRDFGVSDSLATHEIRPFDSYVVGGSS